MYLAGHIRRLRGLHVALGPDVAYACCKGCLDDCLCWVRNILNQTISYNQINNLKILKRTYLIIIKKQLYYLNSPPSTFTVQTAQCMTKRWIAFFPLFYSYSVTYYWNFETKFSQRQQMSKFYFSNFIIPSNSVITNSSGRAFFGRYNWVSSQPGLVITGLICALKWPISLKNSFVLTRCLLTTEFVITEFKCIL